MAGKTPGAKMLHLENDPLVNPQQYDQLQGGQQQQQQQKQDDDDESPKPPGPTGFEAVTPGIQPSTYNTHHNRSYGDQDEENDLGGSGDGPSYFSKADTKIDLLRRVTLSSNMARRESLTEIRASNPDLALSGNIISATFNTPHAFKYRKNGDWVSKYQTLPCF